MVTEGLHLRLSFLAPTCAPECNKMQQRGGWGAAFGREGGKWKVDSRMTIRRLLIVHRALCIITQNITLTVDRLQEEISRSPPRGRNDRQIIHLHIPSTVLWVEIGGSRPRRQKNLESLQKISGIFVDIVIWARDVIGRRRWMATKEGAARGPHKSYSEKNLMPRNVVQTHTGPGNIVVLRNRAKRWNPGPQRRERA